MRMLTRTIHRAFPELDPFDDAKCAKFIKAARGGIWQRLSIFVLAASTFFLVVAFPIAFTSVGSRLGFRFTSFSDWQAIMIASWVAAPILAYLARDLFLRLRVAYVLHCRGRCLSCDYSLLGLRPDPDGLVTCPECQVRTEPDGVFDVLVSESASMPAAPRDARRLASSRRSRILIGAANGLSLIVVVTLLTGVFVALAIEGSLRMQNGRLQAILVSIPRAGELAATVVRDEGKDMWDVFGQSALANMYSGTPGFSRDIRTSNPTNVPAAMLTAAQRDFLAKRRQDGSIDTLRAMASCIPRFTPPPSNGPDDSRWTDQAQSEQLLFSASLNALRMYEAIEVGNVAEFTNAAKVGLLISTTLSARAVDGDVGRGQCAEFLTHAAVLAGLGSALGEQLAPELEVVYRDLPRQFPPDHMWTALRSGAAFAIASRFRTPSGFGPGDLTTILDRRLRLWGRYVDGSLRLGAQLGTFDNYVATLAAVASMPLARRLPLPAPPALYWYTSWRRGFLFSDPADHIAAVDLTGLQLAGIRAWLTIERYKRVNGTYPESLEQMANELKVPLPIDPWTGTAFGYHSGEGKTTIGGIKSTPGFLLFSRGTDDVEDLLVGDQVPGRVRMLPRAVTLDPDVGPPVLDGPRDILINAAN